MFAASQECRLEAGNDIAHNPFVSSELPVKWIKELEEETSALKGQPIYVTCELNKERDVIWKKDGAVLTKKAGKVQINVIGMQHAVTVQHSTEEDAGSYSCEVANQEDVKTSTNVKVIGEQKIGFKHTEFKKKYPYLIIPLVILALK